MNLTLSADPELVRKMREVAAQRGSSLNQMIREYMEVVTGSADLSDRAEEFARLATEHAGSAPKGYRFDRAQAHER